LGALEELQVLDVCAEQGVRLTFFLFPTDDTESMTNAGKLFFYAGDRVDYVIVHNPAKARGDLFKGSQLEKQLMEFGAKSVTLPAVTPTTLLAIEKAEAIAKRGLSFAELSHVEAGHLERLLAGEIQWAMQNVPAIRRHRGFVVADGVCSQRKIRADEGKSEGRTAAAIEFWRMTYGRHLFRFVVQRPVRR
jgi:hypothetical protein